MEMNEILTSPLTGDPSKSRRFCSSFVIEIDEFIGKWCADLRDLNEMAFERLDGATRALLIAKINEIDKIGTKFPLVIFGDIDFSNFELPENQKYVPIFITELNRKTKLISFREKAFQTLRKLVDVEKSPGDGVETAIKSEAGYPGMAFNEGPTGKSLLWGYCCQESELLLVYRWLSEEGLIFPENPKMFITPKGYDENSKFGTGDIDGLHHIFLVCAFTNVDEAVLLARFKPVEDRIRVSINRVSEYEHNNDIDDEILLRIQSASLVIVDVELENFNVGFEAGYAFALNKTIIYTCQNCIAGDYRLPFDITTRNVIDYKGNDEEFIDRLSNRIKFCLPLPSSS